MNHAIRIQWPRLALTMLTVALVALPVRAWENATTDSLRGTRWTGAEAKLSETKLYVGNTLNSLSFSAEQLQTLREAAAEATAVTAKYREKFKALYPEQEKAFRMLYEQNLRHGGAPADALEQAASVNRQGQELVKDFCAEINNISDRMQRTFPASQAVRLEDAVKGLQDRKKKLAGNDNRELAAVQTEIQDVDAAQFGNVVPLGKLLLLPDLDGMLGKRLEKTPPIPTGQPAPKAPVGNAPSRDPGKPYVPPPPPPPAPPPPGPGPAAALNPGLFFTIQGQPAGTEVKDLREQIALLNLINSLNLTTNQTEPIIRLAREQNRQALPDLLNGELKTRAGQDYRATIEELQCAVDQGEILTPEDERQLQRRREQALLVELRERGYTGKAPSTAVPLAEAVARVRGTLTDYQKQLLLDFKPCLIPPRSTANPGVAGQAYDPTGATKLLDKVRNVPDDTWEDVKPKLIDEVFARLKTRQGEFPVEQAADYRQRLEEILDRAKAMDEVDFQIREAKLAQEMEFLDRRQGLAREEVKIKGEDQVLDEKIRAFLLNPRTAELLEKRQVR